MKREFAIDKLIEYSDKCINMLDLCHKLGIENVGGEDYKEVRRLAKTLGIELKFSYKKSYQANKFKKIPFSEILVENSCYSNMSTLKQRLVKEGLKEYKCEKCGITSWMGNDISLQIHHINGVHNDNRIENIQFLCPNCHSQTENYSGKNSNRENNTIVTNKKRSLNIDDWRKIKEDMWNKNHPSKEILINVFKSVRNFSKIGKMYGVSDKSITKWFKRYGLPYRKRDLEKYIEENNL